MSSSKLAPPTPAAARLQQVSSHLKPTPTLLLDGQVVVITGGAQGIGRAAAELFALHGAKIVISDLDKTKADEVCGMLQQRGTETLCVAGDALKDGFAPALIEAALGHFGRINCVINNAGFCYDSAIHKMSEGQFDTIMKIHNYVPFRVVQALSKHWMDPAMRDEPKSIINVSSTSGLHGQLGQINYATAKAGIIGLTKTVAAEWARYNVRCNAVAPGWIDTRITRPPEQNEVLTVGQEEIRMGVPLAAKKFRDTSDIPLGRSGTAGEVAGCMLFLASPLASYVTGDVIQCTGGRYM